MIFRGAIPTNLDCGACFNNQNCRPCCFLTLLFATIHLYHTCLSPTLFYNRICNCLHLLSVKIKEFKKRSNIIHIVSGSAGSEGMSVQIPPLYLTAPTMPALGPQMGRRSLEYMTGWHPLPGTQQLIHKKSGKSDKAQSKLLISP